MQTMFSAVENGDEELTKQVANDIESAKANGIVDTKEVKYENRGDGKVAITDKETGEVTIAERAADEAEMYELVPECATPDAQLEGYLHPLDGEGHKGNQTGAPDEHESDHFEGNIAPNLPNGGRNDAAGHERSVEEIAQGCPKCGKNPCECQPTPPKPCPVCGHLPCTCPGGQPKKKVVVKLSHLRELTLHTVWDERIQFGDELLTIEEYIKRLFGMLPTFLDGEEDLRERWSQPESRQQLLDVLEESGFPEDKLEMTRRFLELEQCDMLDVLAFLAYNTTPMERQRRAEILQAQAMKQYSKAQQDFVNYIMQLYVRNGFKELGSEKLPTLIQMKYHSPHDAVKELKMQPAEIRQFFLGMQQQLYKGMGTVNVEIHNHYHGTIDQLTINE